MTLIPPTPMTRMTRDGGFQTAEAIGIAAVGIIVLLAVAAALESLGIEVVTWMRNSLVRG